jgi:cell shape-determining protein MreC
MNKYRLAIIALLILLIFCFGVYFSSLQHDSKSLKQINKLNSVINNKSQELETKLQKVKTYERQNNKKTQAIGNAVNSNCISRDFVELFNKQTADYEQILSTKHIN